MYPDEDLGRVRGLVVFGNDNGGDAYALDRRDATDPGAASTTSPATARRSG
jgi:hypothetical protein